MDTTTDLVTCDNCGLTFPPGTPEATLPEHGCADRAARRRDERLLADRTVVYPTVTHRRQAEIVLQQASAGRAEVGRISGILGLGKPGNGRYVRHLDLDCLHVVETAGGPFGDRAPFTVIYDGKDTHTYFTCLDEALLYAIELRNLGAEHGGYVFAARALGVKTAYDKD